MMSQVQAGLLQTRKEGYFDGTTFHRVIPGFVIQGGDPNSKDDDRMNDGTGGRAGKYFGDETDDYVGNFLSVHRLRPRNDDSDEIGRAHV